VKPIVEDYMNLGYKVVHEFLRRNPTLYHLREDLEQEAMLAIVEGAAKWKDQGTIMFSTYVAVEVQNAILKYLRDKENKYHRVVAKSLEEILLSPETTPEGDSSWEDVIPGSVVDFDTVLSKLPADCQTFVSYVNSGYTMKQIATAMGIGSSKVSELKELVKEKISECSAIG